MYLRKRRWFRRFDAKAKYNTEDFRNVRYFCNLFHDCINIGSFDL